MQQQTDNTQDSKVKKGVVIEYERWPYKVVNTFGDLIHVRPMTGNGRRVRMHSPTMTLKYENGILTDKINLGKSFETLKNTIMEKENKYTMVNSFGVWHLEKNGKVAFGVPDQYVNDMIELISKSQAYDKFINDDLPSELFTQNTEK